MSDRLTQLQNAVDDLVMQMYGTLNYIQTNHPYGDFPAQPSQAPSKDNDGNEEVNGIAAPAVANGNALKTENNTPKPENAAAFQASLRELAQSLVLQEQKTEFLINSLPGLGSSERDQLRRIQELELDLKEAESNRAQAEKDKVKMLKQLDDMVLSLGRNTFRPSDSVVSS